MDVEMGSSAFRPSCLSFTSSSHTSNGSIDYSMIYDTSGSELSTVAIGKFKPTSTFDQLLSDASSKFNDAEIVVEGVSVGVQQCLLAARSKFFHDLFSKEKGDSEKEGKPRYCMTDILPPYGKVGYEAFLTFLSFLKCGKLKHFPPEVSTCVDTTCAHDSCRPAINYAVELMYASYVFQVPELGSLIQRHLLSFVDKALVEDVILLLIVAFHFQLGQLLTCCVDRVARSDLERICIEKEVPSEVADNIKILRQKFLENENRILPIDRWHEKRIKRIHMALDSKDVALIIRLLEESNISLDEAFALHYAVAYCDSELVTEVLDLDMADVNLRNTRGYTVLHIAAMRKEPSIIVSLLARGAHASDLTLDGQSVVSICRRCTRPKDYHAKTEHGQEANKDRICIDVLEWVMHRNPMAGGAIVSSPLLFYVLKLKLRHLEKRVALARLLFPLEAERAMEIANLEPNGNMTEADLNETPMVYKQKLLSRIRVLSLYLCNISCLYNSYSCAQRRRIVAFGERYFPACFIVLDEHMEDGTPDEQLLQRLLLDLQQTTIEPHNQN